MTQRDIIIIGGGASGLMCALTCATKNKNVTILDSALKVGKKILVSGNGRCNLTNGSITKDCYNIYPAVLDKFNNTDTLALFKSLGLETYFDEEGRCYPKSNHSSAVLDVMLNRLKNLPCEIVTNCEVTDIDYDKNNSHIIVSTANEKYTANKVVIATGGKSIIKILDKLSIKYAPFKRSLCGLIVKENTQLVSGVKTKAKVTVKSDNYSYSEIGEVVFKDNGLSGICIFNISARLNWQGINTGLISLNLEPDKDKDELLALLNDRKNSLRDLEIKHFFDGYFHKNLGLEILNRCKINIHNKVDTLSVDDIKNICSTIVNLEYTFVDTDTNNQVYNGGVELDQLDDNLECKKIPNLYFAGEIINVDGVCGGYNLQWAWTSGHIVGESL